MENNPKKPQAAASPQTTWQFQSKQFFQISHLENTTPDSEPEDKHPK